MDEATDLSSFSSGFAVFINCDNAALYANRSYYIDKTLNLAAFVFLLE